MSTVQKTMDAVITTGEYTDNQGNQKKRYMNIGTLFVYQDGGMSLKLDAFPATGGNISFYEKKPKQNNQGGGNQAPQQNQGYQAPQQQSQAYQQTQQPEGNNQQAPQQQDYSNAQQQPQQPQQTANGAPIVVEGMDNIPF